MNILVTGGAGYIGTHLVKTLLEEKFEVFVIDNLSKGHKDLIPGGKFIKGDLANFNLLSKITKNTDFDAVIHLAADSLVGESMNNPGKYYKNNIMNGINLLETMVENNIFNIVFSSTAAIYGNPESIPIKEKHPKKPTNPYGESKLFFEKILRRYEDIYKIKSISLRYFNAAGADSSGKIGELHDPETHLIPIVLKEAVKKRSNLKVFGDDYPTEDGTCVRDYVHVSDLADAHILSLKSLIKDGKSTTYNLGSQKGYSVKEVIETASEVVNKEIGYEISERRKGDPPVLVADSEKIRKDLGWIPQYKSLKEIIKTAWKWHRKI